ncbi:hypothetical protein Mp_8g07420 [Marchantia polymorpha subsp. ruderalis]|uniref:Aminotransferase class I/classII large domain-containing protein n=1 Tax=Marchantia polymorpha TaxID=3197 RepID=A0A2R6XIC0_MARPO|nr:hypothetical protein MARPO_0013s0051 [Marchantia polymorpha]BBN19027.1 hypothetical protein Mp_8g07420 [Marchantia polymorpha subsp. ruderalis]|eukprot:PTQ45819.1 hypothetical protein MARPO_0013s0051 [Marchantia polymorpha]
MQSMHGEHRCETGVHQPWKPNGQCLTQQNLRELIELGYRERLVLFADEVYQTNVYQDELPFVSAKKVLMGMGGIISRELELVSFHTVSKGFLGECGRRGAYLEMTNIHPLIVEELCKVASISLSPNITGQIMQGNIGISEKAGLYYDGWIQQLQEHSAMYSFPRVMLPPGAFAAAKKEGKAPDAYYCLKLLEATGISTVPGSGFGQKDG